MRQQNQRKHEIATTVRRDVSVHQTGERTQYTTDDIAVEVPVALVYNYISHAVMMLTPDNLEEFAIGFSLTEDIVNAPDDISHIHVHHGQDGITLRMQINDVCYEALKERRRNIVGRTGCGLCGTENLKQAIRPVRQVTPLQLSDEVIQKATHQIRSHQLLQQVTGATHAVGWCDLDGNVLFTREDVGRHNALDKVIGALKINNIETDSGFIVITSRASFEMIQKCTHAGIGALIAISAPTSLAIGLAKQANLLLIGFARTKRHVIYHDPRDASEQKRSVAI